MKRKCPLLVGLAVMAAAIAVGLMPAGLSPEKARYSVVIIDATVETTPNPFAFLFGRYENAFGVHSPSKEIVHYRGSGFLLNGHLITAAHVVVADQGDKVLSISALCFSGKKVAVEVARVSKESDLAELTVVKGESLDIPSLELAGHQPSVGDAVVQIGHPAMIPWVISRGTLVGYDAEDHCNVATLDTYGGNSGGPDMNSRGQVIGLCHIILRGTRFTGIGTFTDLRSFISLETIR